MFSSFLESLQELVFPSYCLSCNQRLPFRHIPLLCSKCLQDIATISSPLCRCCGMPFTSGQDHLCGLCLQQKYAFDLARTAVYYQEPVSTLISALKFNGTLAGLTTLANFGVACPGFRELSLPDIIIPVPLHIKRLRERKFNQALLICRACFARDKHRINLDILVRQRPTSSQTGLSGMERRKNLAGAFFVQKPELVKNKNILLIDDVFTTGSTVNECAKVLRKAGTKRIEVFTLARAI